MPRSVVNRQQLKLSWLFWGVLLLAANCQIAFGDYGKERFSIGAACVLFCWCLCAEWNIGMVWHHRKRHGLSDKATFGYVVPGLAWLLLMLSLFVFSVSRRFPSVLGTTSISLMVILQPIVNIHYISRLRTVRVWLSISAISTSVLAWAVVVIGFLSRHR